MAEVGLQHGVAVLRRLGYELGGDVAGGPGAVLDHHGLAGDLRQAVGDDASDRVGAGAGGGSGGGLFEVPGGFGDAAEFAAKWVAKIIGLDALRGQVVNLNLPATAASTWKAPRLAPHGHSGFRETYQAQRDSKDRTIWRLHGEWIARPDGEMSDATLLSAGHPVFTHLRPNLNGEPGALTTWLSKQGVAK